MTITQPTNLGSAGAELWCAMTEEFDFTGEPGKIAILERACRVSDQIARLEEATATEPMTAKGSMGQLVIHPFIQEIRQQTSTLNALIKSLGLPETEEEKLSKAEQRSQHARNAAQARWGGAK